MNCLVWKGKLSKIYQRENLNIFNGKGKLSGWPCSSSGKKTRPELNGEKFREGAYSVRGEEW